MGIVNQGINNLVNIGVSELLLFILIFVVVFAILRNINLFGVSKGSDEEKWRESMRRNKPIHTVIGLVFAALSIFPHYYSRFARYDIIPVIENSLAQFSFVILGVICALILLGFFGLKLGTGSNKTNPIRMIVFILSVVFIVFVFGSNMNYWVNPWRNILTPDLVAVVIAILVFALIISFIMGDDKKDKYKMSEFLSDMSGDKVDWKRATGSQKMVDFFKGK